MLSIVGTYQNGYVKLNREYTTNTPVNVIVTFIEDIESTSESGISLANFSFAKSRKNLENFTGSFSETIVEERRAGV
jgi:hypothetical protein